MSILDGKAVVRSKAQLRPMGTALISIGQDALGGWAWMLFDEDGQMIESGTSASCVESAISQGCDAWAEAKIRGEAIGTSPRFLFPDGFPS